MIFPDGTSAKPDKEAAAFFNEMERLGFKYWLSEEDSGTGDAIHLNSTATEWWVVFYNSSRGTIASDLPHGFLAADRSNHPDYERVPYAFSFRTKENGSDFVLINVHLHVDAHAKWPEIEHRNWPDFEQFGGRGITNLPISIRRESDSKLTFVSVM